MTDCPGPCNAACRTSGEGEPIPGEPVWCHRDAARIRQRLADLETLAALLHHAADGYGEAPSDHQRASNGHPPSPSPGFDTLDEIERMLRAWEAEYRRVRAWGTPPVHGRYASVSTEIAAWLGRHFDGILESPFAVEFGDEVLGAHRHLLDQAKAGKQHKRGMVPCPIAHCRMMMLFSTDGGSVYWCAACGHPVGRDEYDELCRMAAPRPVAS